MLDLPSGMRYSRRLSIDRFWHDLDVGLSACEVRSVLKSGHAVVSAPCPNRADFVAEVGCRCR